MKYPEKLTPAALETLIQSTEFHTVHMHGKPFMQCALKLHSGFIVTSKPMTCMDPANFNEETGRELTCADACDRLWELEAYRQFAELNGTTAESN